MRYVCLAIFVLFSQMLISQPQSTYYFRHIDQADGLLHASVKAIVQDSKGFIWILTSNGLQRYDGSRFVNYPFESNDYHALANFSELGLFYNKKENSLWMLNFEIKKLDLQNNTFTLYSTEQVLHDSSFKILPYKAVDGSILYMGNIGSFRKDSTSNTLMPILLSAAFLAPNSSNYFFEDEMQQQTWMTNWQGISLLSKKDGKVYTHAYNPIHDPLLFAIDKKQLTGIMKDSRQNIWISTGTPNFYKYNTSTNKLSIYSLNNISNTKAKKTPGNPLQIVKCMFEDHNHQIWLGTANAGLLKYNEIDHSFTTIVNEDNDKQGLRFNYEIQCIFQDREDNIWIGTDNGISIFNPYQQHSRTIHHEENNPSLPKNEITSFIQTADGNILAGTWGGGITIYDSAWNFKRNIISPAPFEYNLVWSFMQNDDGTVWIGCQHGYLHLYEPTSGKIKTICPPELDHSTIWCMAKQSNGNILLGLHNGKIAVWNKLQNKFYRYNDSISGIAQYYLPVTNIFIDSKQRCWTSTNAGLKQFDPVKRVFSAVYATDKKNPGHISSNFITGIEELDESTLMIGTLHGGMNFLNTSNQSFLYLTSSNGLPANTVHAIKKDGLGNVWFTTDYELYKFKPGDKKFIRYYLEPARLKGEFSNNKIIALQNGNLLTATNNELISFNPESINYTGAGTKVEITGLRIFNQPVLIDSILRHNKPVVLSYQQNFLTIEFSVLNFSNLRQANYYYRLSSIDKDWVAAGENKFASYTNLEPGKYIFSVKSDNGNSTSPQNDFVIIINHPFWKTWWFLICLSAVILTGIYLFVRWRIKNIQTIAAEKLKLQQLHAEHYKSELELEQIINYFSSSLIDKHSIDTVLWDVAKNLIGRLGFVDCMIYLWNNEKSQMTQKAGFGPKGSVEEINKQPFEVAYGQGVVGYVMQHKEAVLIPDTTIDSRYRVDEMERLSEICVPIIYDNELVGIIDSEHHDKNFFTRQHLQLLNTIATLTANKINSIEARHSLQEAKLEMLDINEKLLEARLQALRSQMNPHFIFNCLNSIDNLIQNNEKDKATTYLAKFAQLIRFILETSSHHVVACWKDMETLRLYIELEALRFDNQFTYTLDIASKISYGDYKVPPLVIQPFVENAIHHGLLNKMETDKKLLIAVTVHDNHVHYCIEDNGVGRIKSAGYNQQNRLPHQSMGMQLTSNRINLYNNISQGSVIITDLYDAQHKPVGTRVEVAVYQH